MNRKVLGLLLVLVFTIVGINAYQDWQRGRRLQATMLVGANVAYFSIGYFAGRNS